LGGEKFMLPINYGKNAYWFRFSRYEVFEHEKEIYIIPAQKSEEVIYNPFDYAENIISDHLNYGKSVFEGIEEAEKISRTMDLVKKYGLLGVLTYTEVENYLRAFKYRNQKLHCFNNAGEFIGGENIPRIS
jgi:hypothetical protein